MPGQNFINPPNPRGKEEYTLDGKIPMKHQRESWLNIGVVDGREP